MRMSANAAALGTLIQPLRRQPASLHPVNIRLALAMVNKDMVNALAVRLKHAYFCEILLLFARFSLLKNPVKYNTMFAVNQNQRPSLQFFLYISIH